MDRRKLCDREAVSQESIIRIADIPGVPGPLAVACSGGEIFCIDDTCSHQEASLADGWVEDGCVECPLHESRFDLRTGNPDVAPARQAITTYPVEVIDGVVYLLGNRE